MTPLNKIPEAATEHLHMVDHVCNNSKTNYESQANKKKGKKKKQLPKLQNVQAQYPYQFEL